MEQDRFDDPILEVVGRDEAIQIRARVGEASLLVTDQRLLVAAGDRRLLDVPIDAIRRIQFDIERQRPATLVIVPEHPKDEPQVLAVPKDNYAEVAEALVLVGRRLGHSDDDEAARTG